MNIDQLKELITEELEQKEKKLLEDELNEAERNTLSNKLGVLLSKGKAEEREKIIVDFFKILKTGKGYEKLFTTWPNMPEDKKKAFIDAGMKFDINKGRAKEFAKQIIAATTPQQTEKGAEKLVDDVEAQTGVDLDQADTQQTDKPESDASPDESNKLDPEAFDPGKQDLLDLQKFYNAFRNQFYCDIPPDASVTDRTEAIQNCKRNGIATTKKEQYQLVKDLFKHLDKLIGTEEEEGLARAPKTAVTEVEDPVKVSSRSIANLKKDIKAFERNARGLRSYIDSLDQQSDRMTAVVFKTKIKERAPRMMRIGAMLYNELRTIVSTLQETKQLNEQTDAERFEAAYDKVNSILGDIVKKAIEGKANLNQFKSLMKQAKDTINSVMDIFPQELTFAGGEVKINQIKSEYTKALNIFDNDFSDITQLSDVLQKGEGGLGVIQFVADKIYDFCRELKRIFGIPIDAAFDKKIETGATPTELDGSAPQEKPDEEKTDVPELVASIEDALEDDAKAALEQATEELEKIGRGDDSEAIAVRAEEILANNKAAEEAAKSIAAKEEKFKDEIEKFAAERYAEFEKEALEKYMFTVGRLGQDKFKDELDSLNLQGPEREAVQKFLGLLIDSGTITEGVLTDLVKKDKVIDSNALKAAMKRLSKKDRVFVMKIIRKNYEAFVKMLRSAIKTASKEPQKKEKEKEATKMEVEGVETFKSLFVTGPLSFSSLKKKKQLKNLSSRHYDAAVKLFGLLNLQEKVDEININVSTVAKSIYPKIKSTRTHKGAIGDVFSLEKIQSALEKMKPTMNDDIAALNKMAVDGTLKFVLQTFITYTKKYDIQLSPNDVRRIGRIRLALPPVKRDDPNRGQKGSSDPMDYIPGNPQRVAENKISIAITPLIQKIMREKYG